jgi:hypothetical protein
MIVTSARYPLATKLLALVAVIFFVVVVVVVVVGAGALSKAAAYPPILSDDDVVLLVVVVVDAASEDFVVCPTFSAILSTATGGSTNAGKCDSSWSFGGVGGAAFFGDDGGCWGCCFVVVVPLAFRRERDPLGLDKFFDCCCFLGLRLGCFRGGDTGGAGNASALGSKAVIVGRGVKGDVAAVEADLSRALTGSPFNDFDRKSNMTFIISSREVASKVTNL